MEKREFNVMKINATERNMMNKKSVLSEMT